MYLSKIMISGAACRNTYEIHRALWKLFSPETDAKRDFLFRIERSGQQKAEILMQSLREPTINTGKNVHLLQSKPYELPQKQGQRLRFMLVANPIKTINDQDGRLTTGGEVKKCRVPLIQEEELQAWLIRKMSGAAGIESVEIEKRQHMNFRKASEKRVGKIQPVSFQGILSIKNPAEMKSLIQTGVGPAKAFGCGLLSLARY